MLLLGYFVLLAVGLNCNAAPVPCGPPPRDSEFELQGTLQESYPPGTTLTFNCRPGYSRQGSIKKVCADGNWASIAQGVCKRKSCGHPGDIEFGTFDLKEGDGFVFGAVVEYSCDEGYQMVSKQRTRECTATGWSHYPPHCEVRKCPPVEAAAGVKVITTSYDDEEFSVGQVVKFQCQDPKLKLDGLSEIFCTSEGTWSADPPQCTTITCKEPTITNGRVENPRAIYNEGEKLPFKCNKKYKPYRSEDVICKANGWSPEPLCEDISCYPDYVANGKVEKTKEIYKEGDTIVLNCNYGYQIEFSPDEPRKCTANGWFPPLKCISQTCIRPEIADGQLYYNYYFPKELGTYIDYRCSDGFRTQNKRYYGRSYCTENGWNPKPKCTKTCSSYNAQVENGYLQNSDDYYLVGEKVQFSCRQSYLTKDKQNNGERECLPNGKFTEDQCSKFCDVTQLPVGNYAPDKKIFVVGETLLFECNNGFVIASGKTTTNIQCLQTGWSTFPRCIEYKCVVEGTNLISQRRDYKIGEVAQISCPPDYTLKGSELIQCYNNGWGPELPKCEQEIKCNLPRIQESNLVKKPNRLNFKVNEEVSLSCHKNLFLNGANLTRCTSDGWVPTLPVCQKDIPKPHEDDEQPEKGQTCIRPEIADGQLYYYYYFPKQLGTYIDYRCSDGFLPQDKRYYGRSYCTENGWNPKPKCTKTCSRYNAQVEKGYLQNSDDYYLVGEKVQFSCKQSYLTKDKQKNGERECLPNGKFTEDQCSKFCDVTQLPVGKYAPDKKIFVVGETLLFECNNGFVISSGKTTTNIQCLQTGWSTFPRCIEYKCVVEGTNLISQRRDYKIGEVAQISCPPDYTLKGSELIQCYNNGWGPELPKCEQEIKCTLPRFKESNLVKNPNKLNFKVNEEVSLSCHKNLFLNGANLIRCTSDGWVPTLPVCQKDIPKPHEDDEQPEKVCTIPNINLIRSPHYPSYVVGKEVQFSCQDNFQRIGQRTSICTQDGWKPDLPTCQARNPEPTQASTESATQEENEGKGPQLRKRINESFITPENPEPTQPSTESARQEKRQKCPPAHSPINAEIKNPKAEYYSGDTVEIECSPKYILNGDRIILCKDGKWQSSPQCIPLQKCPKPPIIKDGEITEETRKSEYFTDDIVKYSCNPGFHITGSDESRCTERTWLAAPQCTEDPCSPPPSVTNANVVNKKKLYKHGEYAEYVCVNNYKIAEDKPATCLEGKWWHVPTCVYISCSPPPEIENGVLTGYKKNQYASGEKVRYRCNNGYAFEKKTNEKSEAICEETQWKSLPVCRKIGERCGPAPVVKYGDYLGPKLNYYKSGYTMQYKCPNFYKTEGETLVRCENGVWGDPPVCIEPCTANAKDMKENNIDFKWIAENKLYSEHDDEMEFRCINGFEISNPTHLRVKCNRGVILYPKCTKIGSCLISQSTMKQQNIYLNRSSEISNGETVTFECYEKMVPENFLQATCMNGKLDYPKCLFAEKCKSAPVVQNGKLKGEQNQGGYDSGSTVEFECDPQHVLSGPISVKCERGQWSDLPQCLKPCKISTKDLSARNVELISPEDENIYENGDEVNVKCKTGFKNPNSGNPLKGECNDGKMKYPKCFQGSTCRLSQDVLDERNVELHTNENNDVYYGNGETITFKCKIGFHSTSELTGKCENQILTYPSCTLRESSV